MSVPEFESTPLGTAPVHGDQVQIPPDYSANDYIRDMVKEHFAQSPLDFTGLPPGLDALLDLFLPSMIGSRESLVSMGASDLDREGSFFCTVVALSVENFVLRCRLARLKGVPEAKLMDHVLNARDAA